MSGPVFCSLAQTKFYTNITVEYIWSKIFAHQYASCSPSIECMIGLTCKAASRSEPMNINCLLEIIKIKAKQLKKD